MYFREEEELSLTVHATLTPDLGQIGTEMCEIKFSLRWDKMTFLNDLSVVISGKSKIIFTSNIILNNSQLYVLLPKTNLDH